MHGGFDSACPRPQRPLGSRPEGPRERWAPPEEHEQGWVVPAKLGQRLYEKSRLGQRLQDGRVVLSPEEVLFCHWNRHLALPFDGWLETALSKDPHLLQRAVVLDGCSGGEVLVFNVPTEPRWGLVGRAFQTPCASGGQRGLVHIHSGRDQGRLEDAINDDRAGLLSEVHRR